MPVDMFLKIDTIPGESKDTKHKDWIEIESFSWGMSQTGTVGGGGGGAGQAVLQDLAVGKSFDKATPKLMQACANGTHIPSAILSCRKAQAGARITDAFLKVKLENIIVSSLATGGSSSSDVPVDQVSFNYEKIIWSYQEQDEKGEPFGPVEEAVIAQNPGAA